MRTLAILAFALLAGCSSFDGKWRAAGQPGPLRAATRWDGRWTSNYHRSPAGGGAMSGRLRCVLEPVDAARMRAHFHANWLVFAGDYTVPLAVVTPPSARRSGGSIKLAGTHELPKIFGGIYRYEARITGDRFAARYSSSYDAGTFTMTRQLTNPTTFH
jgi:hypothetical protein